MNKSIRNNLIIPLLSVLLLLIVWYVAAIIVDSEPILPTPSEAIKKLGEILTSDDFPITATSTLLRGVVGFMIALLLATGLSIVSGIWSWLDKALSPIIAVLRAIPTMSIILMALIWMNSSSTPVLIGFLIVFPAMYSSILSAIKGVDPKLIEMSRIYNVSRRDMVKCLYIPSVLPALTDSAASGISLNIKVVIASEVLAQTTNSIGIAMQQARTFIDAPALMAWTVIAVGMSFLLEYIVKAIGKLIMRRCYGAK